MSLAYQIFDIFVHLDKHLAAIVLQYGVLTYGILFVVVFCETGLVVTPFLPGDSLLFAIGALSASGAMDVFIIAPLLFLAAITGNTVNYHVGKFIGPKVFEMENSRIFKKEYLKKTHGYFEKYGAKTIVIAQFVPIVRTFSPFLAGVGTMSYLKFATYNVGGALLWVTLFTSAGYCFGEVPIVKQNFTLVIFAIILISIMPAVFEAWRAKRARASAS